MRKRGLSLFTFTLVRKTMVCPLMLLMVALFMFPPAAEPQDTDAVPRPVIEIQKYGVDLSGVYSLTLTSDRVVRLSSRFPPNFSIKRSHVLSIDEYNSAVSLLQGERFKKLEAVPPDPSVPSNTLHHNVSARVTFSWEGSENTQLLATHMNSHMRLLADLITLLKVESLRCPFMIEWHGKPRDWCVVEKELQRQIDERNSK